MSWQLYPISEFSRHQDSWEALNSGSRGTPLLALDFVLPLLEAFGSGSELLGCYECNGRLRAMTVLAPRGRGRWDTFQPSQSPLGLWLHDGSTADWPDLIGGLLARLPGFALACGITQQDPDLMPRPQDGGAVRTMDHIRTARTVISGSFDQYWESRGKNLRANLRKQRNRLQKNGVRTCLEVVEQAQDMAAAVADYGSLESGGWKARAGTAVHADNRQGLFYRRMLENFARRGAGRVYRYRYDDRLVASYLCVTGNGCIVILKTAYEEAVGNDTSPSLLMRQEIFRKLFDEGELKTIESYGKVVDWNSKWCDEVRVLYHINGYRWRALPALRAMLGALPGRRAIMTPDPAQG